MRSGLAHLLTAADNGVLAIGSCMVCYWSLYALVTDHVNGGWTRVELYKLLSGRRFVTA